MVASAAAALAFAAVASAFAVVAASAFAVVVAWRLEATAAEMDTRAVLLPRAAVGLVDRQQQPLQHQQSKGNGETNGETETSTKTSTERVKLRE